MRHADRRVLCVAAGMLHPKKVDNPLARSHLYLNYGLLSLASVLKTQGYDPLVIQGNFQGPQAFLAEIQAAGWTEVELPVLVSLPSCFAIPWTREFVRLLREITPQCRIIVGGRWVVARDGAWVRNQIPGVDLVVFGTAEHLIGALLDSSSWSLIPNTDRSTVHDWPQPSAQCLGWITAC